jgi:hypothetical protein
MLYTITLVFFTVWLILLIRKRTLSWHSIIVAYLLSCAIIDPAEILLNLILELYKFPTKLISDPIYDNQFGLFFSDPLILPFAFIILVYYSLKFKWWKAMVLYTLLFTVLELIFLKSGFLQYNNWKLIYSVFVYACAYFCISKYFAKRIAYNPPIPRPIRLFGVTYTANMWIGATFSLPVLNLYHFSPGLFKNPMADDRFADLFSGWVLGWIFALLIPRIPSRLKLLTLVLITIISMSWGLFAYYSGWLIYHQWNHFFMLLRYLVPCVLIIIYDSWEMSFISQYDYSRKSPHKRDV